ncbi:MAG TPA: radical SAM protein [Desulfuromonadales bacterium]|nr:radical SAM protein [Desulfuromonadales bacterium]
MRTILTTLHSKYIHPSLALPYLAAFCARECGELAIREFTVHEPKENVLAALLDEKPDVVAFSVYLWNRRETLELIDALAVAAPKIRLVLGGPEVSFDGAGLFECHPGLSALVRGEGELPFRALLSSWAKGSEPQDVPRLTIRGAEGLNVGPNGPPLADLDDIPSPFKAGLVDLSRGFVYLETSRGCPYSCAFCMSALDERVRSFSMDRIRTDLSLLMEQEVPKIKFVDRTFNYDAARARDIFTFILEHNCKSHFHFEIGAHLLDEPTLNLLTAVPADTFQFEIGVQSTLPSTLATIGRQASLRRLEDNVRFLQETTKIHLHLDLIAGLPGEDYDEFLSSIDKVAALAPHHLQIEPVKLLPGAPLRQQAPSLGLCHDPNPPYTVLATADLSFQELESLRGISRLFDLTWNSRRARGFLDGLSNVSGSLARGLERIEKAWQSRGLFRHPLSQRSVFEALAAICLDLFDDSDATRLRELLARDFAHCERVAYNNAPTFFTALNSLDEDIVRGRVHEEAKAIKGMDIKLQHFAARFAHLPDLPSPAILLFLYLTRTGEGLSVKEITLPAARL